MSEILTKMVVDCSTGIHETIPLTTEEIAEMQANAEAAADAQEAQAAEEAEAAEAKASGIAKLLALGLTEEEANALIN